MWYFDYLTFGGTQINAILRNDPRGYAIKNLKVIIDNEVAYVEVPSLDEAKNLMGMVVDGFFKIVDGMLLPSADDIIPQEPVVPRKGYRQPISRGERIENKKHLDPNHKGGSRRRKGCHNTDKQRKKEYRRKMRHERIAYDTPIPFDEWYKEHMWQFRNNFMYFPDDEWKIYMRAKKAYDKLVGCDKEDRFYENLVIDPEYVNWVIYNN